MPSNGVGVSQSGIWGVFEGCLVCHRTILRRCVIERYLVCRRTICGSYIRTICCVSPNGIWCVTKRCLVCHRTIFGCVIISGVSIEWYFVRHRTMFGVSSNGNLVCHRTIFSAPSNGRDGPEWSTMASKVVCAFVAVFITFTHRKK